MRSPYLVNAGIFRELRSVWRAIACKHTHQFVLGLDAARREYGDPVGSRRSSGTGLLLVGCYKCGKVSVVDYMA
jgi:hypothetical protein